MLFINPGSGPVRGATRENADENMKVFVQDLRDNGNEIVDFEIQNNQEPDDGRYVYGVHQADGKTIEIEMPGLPVEQVRYVGEDNQNIWDFPRLYVDGSSWVWEFALWSPGDFDEDEE